MKRMWHAIVAALICKQFGHNYKRKVLSHKGSFFMSSRCRRCKNGSAMIGM